VDHERLGGSDTFITIWVQSPLRFLTYYEQTDSDVIFHHGHHGRVIDLEVRQKGTASTGITFRYDTVNLAH
jgi:hypothetical protein